MVANVEYAKVIVNSDLKVSMVTKKCTNAWTFTVTSKVRYNMGLIARKPVFGASQTINRVHTRQGNVREILFFSRLGNCQGILCCVREK